MLAGVWMKLLLLSDLNNNIICNADGDRAALSNWSNSRKPMVDCRAGWFWWWKCEYDARRSRVDAQKRRRRTDANLEEWCHSNPFLTPARHTLKLRARSCSWWRAMIDVTHFRTYCAVCGANIVFYSWRKRDEVRTNFNRSLMIHHHHSLRRLTFPL